MNVAAKNPFQYGKVVRGKEFTGRKAEIQEITNDLMNGQDLVILAPRRYGKTSLIDRVIESKDFDATIVIKVDLMETPTKEKMAGKILASIHDNKDKFGHSISDLLKAFKSLRIQPRIDVTPEGGLSFSFPFTVQKSELDTTLGEILRLPGKLVGKKNIPIIFVFDEFQEIMDIDPGLPKVMRAIFQQQTKTAHVYLGSKKHVIQGMFNDRNAPFWKSAKQVEVGKIDVNVFTKFIEDQFKSTGGRIPHIVAEQVLATTKAHPYATQELCYFLWEEARTHQECTEELVGLALQKLLRAENAYFSLIWSELSAQQKLLLLALSKETGSPMTEDYRSRHGLPSVASIQIALKQMQKKEIVESISRGKWSVSEPFLAEWVRAEKE